MGDERTGRHLGRLRKLVSWLGRPGIDSVVDDMAVVWRDSDER